MDEREWLTSADPQAMLTSLRDSGRLTERKARLFAVACCRRIWHLLTDERSRAAVEMAERRADGEIGRREFKAAKRAAWAVRFQGNCSHSTAAVCEVMEGRILASLPHFIWLTQADSDVGKQGSDHQQADILRDLFAPLPFREALVSPAWLVADNGVTLKLAQTAYDERLLPAGHLDPARLAVLADALEEAGADGELVAHLRGPGPHVRGCWVADLLLGKS